VLDLKAKGVWYAFAIVCFLYFSTNLVVITLTKWENITRDELDEKDEKKHKKEKEDKKLEMGIAIKDDKIIKGSTECLSENVVREDEYLIKD